MNRQKRVKSLRETSLASVVQLVQTGIEISAEKSFQKVAAISNSEIREQSYETFSLRYFSEAY
jgi:hypothetical protein